MNVVCKEKEKTLNKLWNDEQLNVSDRKIMFKRTRISELTNENRCSVNSSQYNGSGL